MKNIVYVLTNPCIPDLVKIGMTNNLKNRLGSLYNSSIPVPFECYFACTVSDMEFVEKQIHDGFDDFRVNPKREFFRINPERVVSVLNLVMIDDVTPKEDIVEDEIDQRSLNNEKKTKDRFNFEMTKVPIGSVLSFVKDPSITAIVVDKHKIEFNGEVTSLSKSALEIMKGMGYNWKTIKGTGFWTFESETLTERRTRIEQE
jgi:hypothetical protein